MKQSTPAFLTPLSAEDFFSQYWEQQPLHIARDDDELSTLIDLPAIETLLSTQPLYFPGVQLTQSGKTIDVSNYADNGNAILPLRLFELHAQGATIVLSQAQKLFPALDDVCREVIRSLKMGCQANVYVSPPANQGFNAHYDTHDVFILQVSGAKTFNFYPSSVHLPCTDEQFDASRISTAPIDESIRLTAGDTLYIPRGIVHDAIADESSSSVHITLGVYPILMRDVLLQAVRYQSSCDSRLRRSVNPFAQTEADLNALRQTMTTLLQQTGDSLNDEQTLSGIINGLCDELSLGASQDCRGLSSRQIKRTDTTRDGNSHPAYSNISLRRNMVIHHQYRAPHLKLHTFGQIIEFDEPASQVIDKLLEQGFLCRADLDILDFDQRDALLRQLLQENLIELS